MIIPLFCNPEYKVSSDGFIISKRDNTPMKPSKNPRGYLITNIMMPDGSIKGISIHGAVAKSFLGDKTADGLQINHIDGDKENNRLENLEWVTPKENSMHSVRVLGKNVGAKNCNAKGVLGFDKQTNELLYSYDSIADCARAIAKPNENFRYVQSRICCVLKGHRKSYRGCVWKYKNE